MANISQDIFFPNDANLIGGRNAAMKIDGIPSYLVPIPFYMQNEWYTNGSLTSNDIASPFTFHSKQTSCLGGQGHLICNKLWLLMSHTPCQTFYFTFSIYITFLWYLKLIMV